ncbi:hypothetical protein J1614_003639 [Plenodomus biglobosus]|nr:hypothetical protein J1614_003639 [Plenodomus biglobosus]
MDGTQNIGASAPLKQVAKGLKEHKKAQKGKTLARRAAAAAVAKSRMSRSPSFAVLIKDENIWVDPVVVRKGPANTVDVNCLGQLAANETNSEELSINAANAIKVMIGELATDTYNYAHSKPPATIAASQPKKVDSAFPCPNIELIDNEDHAHIASDIQAYRRALEAALYQNMETPMQMLARLHYTTSISTEHHHIINDDGQYGDANTNSDVGLQLANMGNNVAGAPRVKCLDDNGFEITPVFLALDLELDFNMNLKTMNSGELSIFPAAPTLVCAGNGGIPTQISPTSPSASSMVDEDDDNHQPCEPIDSAFDATTEEYAGQLRTPSIISLDALFSAVAKDGGLATSSTINPRSPLTLEEIEANLKPNDDTAETVIRDKQGIHSRTNSITPVESLFSRVAATRSGSITSISSASSSHTLTEVESKLKPSQHVTTHQISLNKAKAKLRSGVSIPIDALFSMSSCSGISTATAPVTLGEVEKKIESRQADIYLIPPHTNTTPCASSTLRGISLQL